MNNIEIFNETNNEIKEIIFFALLLLKLLSINKLL